MKFFVVFLLLFTGLQWTVLATPDLNEWKASCRKKITEIEQEPIIRDRYQEHQSVENVQRLKQKLDTLLYQIGRMGQNANIGQRENKEQNANLNLLIKLVQQLRTDFNTLVTDIELVHLQECDPSEWTKERRNEKFIHTILRKLSENTSQKALELKPQKKSMEQKLNELIVKANECLSKSLTELNKIKNFENGANAKAFASRKTNFGKSVKELRDTFRSAFLSIIGNAEYKPNITPKHIESMFNQKSSDQAEGFKLIFSIEDMEESIKEIQNAFKISFEETGRPSEVPPLGVYANPLAELCRRAQNAADGTFIKAQSQFALDSIVRRLSKAETAVRHLLANDLHFLLLVGDDQPLFSIGSEGFVENGEFLQNIRKALENPQKILQKHREKFHKALALIQWAKIFQSSEANDALESMQLISEET
uniref:Uncharacterized protein n=1 Tax=Globodera rostochiensis TaxID=31243 RepID=A0A914IG01_GLORO